MDTQDLRTDTHWLAWAAGIIDGEGTILLARQRANKTWTLRVVVGNTDPRMIATLHDLFGGSVSFAAAREHRRAVWRWYVYHKKAEACLQRILPWLRAKRDQAELGLQHRRLVQSRRGPRRGHFRDPLLDDRMRDLAAQMTALRAGQPVPQSSCGAADDQLGLI